jgi:hypothetical protein
LCCQDERRCRARAPSIRKDERGEAQPPTLLRLSALGATIATPLSFFVSFQAVLTYSFSVAAVLVGLWLSCVLFAIVSWTADQLDRDHALVIGSPTAAGLAVVVVLAALKAIAGDAPVPQQPAPKDPAAEAILKTDFARDVFTGDSTAAYGVDRNGRLFAITLDGAWRRRYVRQEPLSAVTAVSPCGGWLAVAFGHGSVGVVSTFDGSLADKRRYTHEDLSLACVGKWIFVVGRQSGAILRIKAATLEPYSDWVAPRTPITAIVAGADRIFVASRPGDRIGVIADLDGSFVNTSIAWTDGVHAPDAVAAAGNHLFVNRAGMHCVSRFDKDGVEHMPRVPVGGGATHLVASGRDAYAVGEDSGKLVDVTYAGTRRLGRWVKVASLPVGVALAGGRLFVADDGRKPAVRVYTRDALQRATRHGKFSSGACH